MSLFQKSVQKKQLQSLDKASVEAAWERYAAHFLDIAKQENIRNSKEEQYQEGFLRELFVDVLGYVLNPSPGFNLTTELKNIGNAKKADGGIVQGEKVLGVIELKGTETVNLDKVTDQAFGYKSNQRDCRYVIVSNFERLRLYVDDATDHEEFDLFEMSPDRFRLLYLLLAADYLFAGMPARMKQESALQEKDITDRFYKDYSAFKNALFEDLRQRNPYEGASGDTFQKGVTASVASPADWHLLLFKKSQKLLDRLLFIFFGEDKGLLPPNLIKKTVDDWDRLRELDEYRPLYDQFKKYFGYINEGTERKEFSIFAYNGGLFEPDEVLDTVKISDPVLYKYTLELSRYDFDEQVDVNILGHIFEHSLNEIEEISAQLDGTAFDKTQTKRKKDGVFYTPRYITQYIVENTVGRLCTERKAALGIVEADYAQERKGRRKDVVKALDQRLDAYQQWLFGLKICDPACGSGALLNEAFDFLIREHGYVAQLRKHLFAEAIPFSVENSILEKNIYGVDINEEAVEIARLSLWLRSAEPGRKLTNLSGHIKVGNSLIDDPAVAGEKAFDWEREFPEVFEQGGFDVVVGNPPYVSSKFDNLKPIEKEFYIKNFKSAVYQIDTYLLFVEKAHYIRHEDGITSLIIPNAWMNNSFLKDVRKSFVETFGLSELVIMPSNAFAQATVDTVVVTFDKIKLESILIKKYVDLEFRDLSNLNRHDLLKSKELIFSIVENESTSKIINKLDDIEHTFGDFFDITRGVGLYHKRVGHTHEFIASDPFVSTFQKDSTFVPLCKGRHIVAYGIEWESNCFISYGNWLAEPRNPTFFEGERIFLRQIPEPSRLLSTWISNKFVADQSIFIAKPKQSGFKFSQAIISSKLMFFYFQNKYNERDEIFPKVKLIHLKSFPIVIPQDEIKAELESKVDNQLFATHNLNETVTQFTRLLRRRFDVEQLPQKLEAWHELSYKEFCAELNKLLQKVHKRKLSIQEDLEWEPLFEEQRAKATALQADILRTDREIDGVVYGLYGLGEEEIKIIENA
ncbi:MAG: N-6 DNA methylase [Saprospiraceae bacterium]|nr:N-6 DNA methylase [Saprospiraceae bacterium]